MSLNQCRTKLIPPPPCNVATPLCRHGSVPPPSPSLPLDHTGRTVHMYIYAEKGECWIIIIKVKGPNWCCRYVRKVKILKYWKAVFRIGIRIRLDPDSNRQSGSGSVSGFGIRIRIQQLKLSFFKAVEGCTDRVGTSKHLFAGGGRFRIQTQNYLREPNKDPELLR